MSMVKTNSHISIPGSYFTQTPNVISTSMFHSGRSSNVAWTSFEMNAEKHCTENKRKH